MHKNAIAPNVTLVAFLLLTHMLAPKANGQIVIDVSDRRLIAYEANGASLLAAPTVALGTMAHPVQAGTYHVIGKLRRLRCEFGSDACVVAWLLEADDGLTIHGRHCKKRMGCHHEHNAVVLRNDDARAVWEWATLGMPVTVQP